MLTVKEIADNYGVTKQAVYLWLSDGLKFEIVKKVGRKAYRQINPDDVKKYLASKAR
jgi:predicted transcriptional regulator